MSTKKANLILTTCSMAWGTSYIFMKLGIEGLSPLMLMALRTGIAFLILVLIFFKRLLNVNKRLLLYSAITGFLLFTNLTPILYGLNTITASQSGFILSTTVVLVPVIHAVISRRLPEHHVRLGIIVVLIGMVLINGGDIFAVKPGTLLCMLSAFSYSINIVLNSYFTRQVDPLALGVYQQGFTCLYSIIGLLVFGSPIFPSTALDWIFCPQLTDSLYKLLCSNIQHRRIPDSCSPWNQSLQRFFPSSSCMRSSRRWDISGPFSFLQECLPLSMPKVR